MNGLSFCLKSYFFQFYFFAPWQGTLTTLGMGMVWGVGAVVCVCVGCVGSGVGGVGGRVGGGGGGGGGGDTNRSKYSYHHPIK